MELGKLEKAAASLSFKQGDATWKRLRARAENDLFWFNSIVLGFADVFPLLEETHIIPHLFMQRNTGIPDIDSAKIQLLMWPRETGKSTCGTVGYAIWMGCKHPNTAVLIANEKEETAKDFIKSIEWHFESNNLLRALFPEVIPPDLSKVEWSSTRATLRRTTGRPEATFDCTGTSGTKTGKHYDIIIGDDLISKEAMEAARAANWSLMERGNRWVNQSKPLLSSAAADKLGLGFPLRRFIGTRWWIGDTYEHIEETFSYGEPKRRYNLRVKLKDGRRISREISRAGDIAVLRMAAVENGRETFPLIWPMEEIEKMRHQDPELAACNLMNDPSDAQIRTFQDEWIKYWRFHDDGKTVVYKLDDNSNRFVRLDSLLLRAVTDPAFSSNSAGSRAAFIILGTDMETSKHLVLEASAKQQDPYENLEDYLSALERWNCRIAYCEVAGQQLAYLQWLQKEARERGMAVSITDVKPGGRNKDVRIEGLIVPFRQGDIIIGPGQSVLVDDEYRHWRPGARKADVLDALAYAIEKAPKPAARGGEAMNAKARSRTSMKHYWNRLAGRRKMMRH